MVTKPVELVEGERVILTTDHLLASDSGSSSEELVYAVSVPPKHGHLHIVQHPGVPLTSFTQMDVAAHRVSYTHDNSHTEAQDYFRLDQCIGGGEKLMETYAAGHFRLNYIYI